MVQIVIPPTRVDYSNLVEDFRGCLLGEKMMDQILRKNKKTTWIRNTISGAYMAASFADIMSWTYQIICTSRRIMSNFIWIPLMSFDTLKRHCKSMKSNILGMSVVNDHNLDLGLHSWGSQASINSHPMDAHMLAGERLTVVRTVSRLDDNRKKPKPGAARRLREMNYISVITNAGRKDWKRICNPPCRVKHKETPKRIRWIVLCQTAGREMRRT